MSDSGGPTLPGASPPLMSWQVRQLPLLRSKASVSPGIGDDAAAGCAGCAIAACGKIGIALNTAPAMIAVIRADLIGADLIRADVVRAGVVRVDFRPPCTAPSCEA